MLKGKCIAALAVYITIEHTGACRGSSFILRCNVWPGLDRQLMQDAKFTCSTTGCLSIDHSQWPWPVRWVSFVPKLVSVNVGQITLLLCAELCEPHFVTAGNTFKPWKAENNSEHRCCSCNMPGIDPVPMSRSVRS